MDVGHLKRIPSLLGGVVNIFLIIFAVLQGVFFEVVDFAPKFFEKNIFLQLLHWLQSNDWYVVDHRCCGTFRYGSG